MHTQFNPEAFPRYCDWDPAVPAWCLTPRVGRCIHRFFDTVPISPSGRYLAVFRFPQEHRLNAPGEAGEIVLIDLRDGSERVVAHTRGWEFQLGANINWGQSDEVLVFNDVDTGNWHPLLVVLNPLTGDRECLAGGVYHVSPCGRYAASCSLEKMVRTQYGYGVRIPEERIARNIGASADDGLFITDLQTGHRRLVLSIADAVGYVPELDAHTLPDWEIYGFHSKWSPDSERLIFTLRRFPAKGKLRLNLISSDDPAQQIRYEVLTLRRDGSDIHNAIPASRWEQGGHHVNWCADSRHISMNLGGFGSGLRFVGTDYRGDSFAALTSHLPGSGHPTVVAAGRYILTDAYETESMAAADHSVPLRWIDTGNGSERVLLRTGSRTNPQPTNVLRVDPHPVFDRSGRYVVFNGVARAENTRRVFIADLGDLCAV